MRLNSTHPSSTPFNPILAQADQPSANRSPAPLRDSTRQTAAAHPNAWSEFSRAAHVTIVSSELLRSRQDRRRILDLAVGCADAAAPLASSRLAPSRPPLDEQLPELYLALRSAFPRRRRAAATLLAHALAKQSLPIDLSVLAVQLARHPDALTRAGALKLLLCEAPRHATLLARLAQRDADSRVRLVAQVGLGADRRWLNCVGEGGDDGNRGNGMRMWELVERAGLVQLPMDKALQQLPPAELARSGPDPEQERRRAHCQRIAAATVGLSEERQFLGIGPWLRQSPQFQSLFFAEAAKIPGVESDTLLVRLARWPHLQDRPALARALGSRPRSTVVVHTIEGLHRSAADTEAVAQALGSQGSLEALEALERLAAAGARRGPIIEALATLGGDRARRAVIGLLHDANPVDLSRSCLLATAELGGFYLEEALGQWARGATPDVAAWAQEALQIMGAAGY